jgi:tetratricopeptide (TPR) repeat protein
MNQRARIQAGAALLVLLLTACSQASGASAYSIATANGYVNAQDWNGLLRYSTAWTQAEPNTPMAWFYLGNTYAREFNQPSRALPAFERAVALQPIWPAAWNALGFINVQLKHYDEAATAFTRAVQQAPAKANYWNSLAAAYSYQNRFLLAVKALEDEQRAIAGSTEFVEWYNLANGLCSMEEFAAAAAAYRRALQLKPDYAPAWNNLGSIESVAGNTRAALDDYQRASALGDGSGANNYARLQQAIAAAQQLNNPDPLEALRRTKEHEVQRLAQQAWAEHLGRNQN